MLTTIGRYFDVWEAHILRARLEAEGIPASVAGAQHASVNWPISIALGGVALQVPIEHLAEAQEILAAYHSGSLEQDLQEFDPIAVDCCPICGSQLVEGFIPRSQRVLAVATFLLAWAPFPTSATQMRCHSCGHSWDYGKETDNPSS